MHPYVIFNDVNEIQHIPVEFDEFNLDCNDLEFWHVCIVGDDDSVEFIERHTDKYGYESALTNVYGREIMHEDTEPISELVTVHADGGTYDVDASIVRRAYVRDAEED